MRRSICCRPTTQLILCLMFVTITSSATAQLGSSWTRNGLPSSSRITGRTIRINYPLPGRATRFFGGVTVGRGFLPYYSPGWSGYDPLYYPGTVVVSACRSGVGAVVNGGLLSPFPTSTGPFPDYWKYPYYTPLPAAYTKGGGGGYSGAGLIDTPGISGASLFDSPSRARVNETPPFDFGRTFTRTVPEAAPQQPIGFSEIKAWLQTAVDAAPVAGEFPAASLHQQSATAIDDSEYLRLLTGGDEALRNGDPELARTLYQAAGQIIPEVGTPLMRMTWVYVAQEDYPRAASSLKQALTATKFDELVWVDQEELLGQGGTAPVELIESGVWQWLEQQPGSADRLLLVAGCQGFEGNARVAADLVKLAHTAGASDLACQRLRAIIIGEHPKRPRLSGTVRTMPLNVASSTVSD